MEGKKTSKVCDVKERYLPVILYVDTIENRPQDYFFHRHDDYCEIVYIEEGTAIFFIDNKKYDIGPGDLAIYNHGVMHAEFYDTDVPIKKHIICISNVMLGGLEENNIIPDWMTPVIKKNSKSEYIETLFKKIISEVKEEEIGYLQTCQGLLLAMFALIRRNFVFNEQSHKDASCAAGTQSLVLQIKEYMDRYFAMDISLKDLSNTFYISTYYLSHLVKNELGYSPIQYIMNLRMGEAQRLLMTTDYPVVRISNMVGYENVGYFSNLFKRHTGATPNEFRNTYRMPLKESKEKVFKRPDA